LNATNGEESWNYDIYGPLESADEVAVFSSASVVNDMIFIGADDDYFYCLDTNTGLLLFKYQTGNDVRSTPSLGYGKVFFGSNDCQIYGFSQFGVKLWNYTTDGAVRSSPAVADGKVYVGSDDGHLYVLDESGGNLLDKFYIGHPIESSPAVDDGKVFVGSDSGDIHAFNGDISPPDIISVDWTPACPTPFVDSAMPREGELVYVQANISDDKSGVDKAMFFYRIDEEDWWNTTMSFNATTSLWTMTIPGQLGGVTVEFFLQAFDNVGNKNTTSMYNYTVKTLVLGDVNGDGKLDALDLFIISKHFGETSL